MVVLQLKGDKGLVRCNPDCEEVLQVRFSFLRDRVFRKQRRLSVDGQTSIRGFYLICFPIKQGNNVSLRETVLTNNIKDLFYLICFPIKHLFPNRTGEQYVTSGNGFN